MYLIQISATEILVTEEMSKIKWSKKNLYNFITLILVKQTYVFW